MSKKFDIHEWQAKRRLNEAAKDTPGGNPDAFYGDDSLIGKLRKDPDYIKKLNARSQEVMHTDDIALLQNLVKKYSLDKIKTNLDVIKSMDPETGEDLRLEPEEEDSYRDMIQGKYSDDDLKLEPEIDEHHNDEDFPGKDLSAWDLLDKLKAGDKELYDKVEVFMKSMKEMNSLGSAGAGASFDAGKGAQYATPKAFGGSKNKKEVLGYKKVKDLNEQNSPKWWKKIK